MSDDPYTKREQDTYRAEVLETLSRIELQTTKTNGRVNNLERWQSYVIGFCAAISILCVPVLIYAVTHWSA